MFGNATVYQWKTGEVPSKIEETVQKVDLEAMARISNEEQAEEVAEVGLEMKIIFTLVDKLYF